jgi:4-amino-4-deoxy-L-arabinose transferase-like glycosyltransferase
MRASAAALVLFAALLLIPGLGRMRAAESTDARYLEISRAMYGSGDWLVPRIAGHPHLDKPPLAYWAASAGFAAFGVTPFAGRLLEQLALALTALLIATAGARLGAPRSAPLAALVFLTSVLTFLTSRGLSTDLFQLLFLTGAMLLFVRGVVEPRRPLAVALALLLLGVSMNAKGPIALFVAASIWLPFLALARARVRVSGRALALGAALFVAVGAPWYVALGIQEPAVLRQLIESQLLGRLTGAADWLGHQHGPFYLLGVWPLVLLPWTPLVALSLFRLRPRGWRNADPIDLYLLLWACVPVLFFSIPRLKAANYLLAGFPAAALAVARALETGRLADATARRCLAACTLASIGLALGGAAVLVFPALITSKQVDAELLIGRPFFAAALGATALALALALRASPRSGGASPRSLAATALGTGAIFLLGFNAVAPGMVSWQEEGLIVRSVPGAWFVQMGTQRPSALFYLGDAERTFVTEEPGDRARSGRTRTGQPAEPLERGIELLASEAPVFCLTRPRHADELMRTTGAAVVRRRDRTVLLANPAAQRLLAQVRNREALPIPGP